MPNKVYALLVRGDIVEGEENLENVTTPKSVRTYYNGHFQTIKPVVSFAHTPKNYEHLVALFGKERVPQADQGIETARSHLLGHTQAIGKVSNISVDHARHSSQYHIVELGSDGETFVVGRDAWKYCVLYNSILQEIKPQPKKPPIKAGDYVMGVSSDLENISAEKYIVVDNGAELVVFDDSGHMLPILEQLELGYFKRIEKE